MRASFVLSEVITGLRRNVTMTIAMILTTAVSLGMLGGGLLIVRTVDETKANYLADIEVSVYLTEDISTNDTSCAQSVCQKLRDELDANENVESVVFENRQAAYERFKRIFKNQPELVEQARPQSLPASLKVKLKDPTLTGLIIEEYAAKPGVQNVDDQRPILDQVFGVLNGLRNVTFVIALVQAFAALLLISNTIQVSAFTRRTEVGIMRLVGATRWYTQLPFLLEAVVAGFVGALLAIGGLIGLKYLFLDRILAKIETIAQFELVDILFPVAPILLACSILISVATGYVTLRLYVRN